MIIVSGHLSVRPEDRATYLAGCVEVVRSARAAAGCLDFAVSADMVDAGRINVHERWATREAVEAFRGTGTPDEQQALLVGADVAEYDVTGEHHLI